MQSWLRSKMKKKLFTTSQILFFLVGLFVTVFIWVTVLRRWMSEGFVTLQPEALTDWFKTLGVFLVLPFGILSILTLLVIVIAVGLQEK